MECVLESAFVSKSDASWDLLVPIHISHSTHRHCLWVGRCGLACVPPPAVRYVTNLSRARIGVRGLQEVAAPGRGSNPARSNPRRWRPIGAPRFSPYRRWAWRAAAAFYNLLYLRSLVLLSCAAGEVPSDICHRFTCFRLAGAGLAQARWPRNKQER